LLAACCHHEYASVFLLDSFLLIFRLLIQRVNVAKKEAWQNTQIAQFHIPKKESSDQNFIL
jgi:hypothetical protein